MAWRDNLIFLSIFVSLVGSFRRGHFTEGLSLNNAITPGISDNVGITAKQPPILFQSHIDNKKASSNSSSNVILTFLEVNGWIMTINGVTILIDPILEGPLDFGIPVMYKASKRTLPPYGLLKQLPPIDCVLITQGLDDHAHMKTLQKLAAMDCEIPIVAPPSARATLSQCNFANASNSSSGNKQSNISYVLPGQDVIIRPRETSDTDKDCAVHVRATSGALVGPPWQQRENGYVIHGITGSSTAGDVEKLGKSVSSTPSVYIEPHVEFSAAELRSEAPVEIAITPICGEGLPAFDLVHGPKDTLRLLNLLKPKYVVPMQNGDVETEGIASKLVQKIGSPQKFFQLLRQQGHSRSRNMEVLDVVPGKDIVITLDQ